ncbi:MAG: VacB/RNase II family 3'-5' exoribonuclease [Thermoguttaceae bacterium]|nr:VacB/RNase II family 3'-5' exoribonuclease [Thermoguttaceae bacterium]
MLKQAETREAILKWIARPQYVPAKMLVVAQQIGILKEDFKEFQKLVRNMNKEGLLRFGAGHVIWPELDAEEDDRRIAGYFKRMPDGYGFVAEVELNPNSENIGDEDQDVFIPPGKTLDAATGDFVSVLLDDDRLAPRARHGKAEVRRRPKERGRSGVIEKILERKTRSFVGTYFENHSGNWVEADGRIFSDPIRIPDTGGCSVRDGDKVVMEILTFPTAWRGGEGVITEVLGPRGDLKTDTMAVMRQFGLSDRFSDEILAEARWQTEQFEKWEEAHRHLWENGEENKNFSSEDEPEWTKDGRRILKDLFTITIDPETARDFDDAVSIEIFQDGKTRLAVHIADVSHFVLPDSRLDREAFDRGNSVYLPDHVIPMLPEILSNGIASLQPDRIRLAKTVFLTYSPSGVCLDVEVCDSVIRSNARLSYEQVDRFFEGERGELPEKVMDTLAKLRYLAKLLRDRRTKKGKLDINLPEIKLILDRDGSVIGVRREENTESHQMIEEFMVSANEAVAQELVSAGSNLMRRVHKAPGMEKFDALGLFLEDLGIPMPQKADRFELQRILEQTKGSPNEFAVHQAVLKAMTRAEYSPEIEGHYALASDCYCHFTSPIRRYADLTIHRQIENFIMGISPKRNFRKIYDEGKHLTYREKNAEEAERELTRTKMIHFFAERGDMDLEARIVGLNHSGFFVECLDYPISGMVSLQALPDDRYRYDVRSQTLAGFRHSFRLGDTVRVHIAQLDSNRREIHFELSSLRNRPFIDDENDMEQLEKFPRWEELDALEASGAAGANPTGKLNVNSSGSSSADSRFAAARNIGKFETNHVRVGGKKRKSRMDHDENADFDLPKTRTPKRSTGAGGGKKNAKNEKNMTRKCKNCAPKGKRK